MFCKCWGLSKNNNNNNENKKSQRKKSFFLRSPKSEVYESDHLGGWTRFRELSAVSTQHIHCNEFWVAVAVQFSTVFHVSQMFLSLFQSRASEHVTQFSVFIHLWVGERLFSC